MAGHFNSLLHSLLILASLPLSPSILTIARIGPAVNMTYCSTISYPNALNMRQLCVVEYQLWQDFPVLCVEVEKPVNSGHPSGPNQ